MTNWKTYKFSELFEIKYGKDHKALSNGSIPVYGSGGIMRYVDKYLYKEESILIPRKGTLSNLFYTNEPFWSVDTMFWTKINTKNSFPKYLYYSLKGLDLASYNVGSAVPSLTTKVLNEIEITIPNLPTQRAIAEILSSLDDKIELNNQMNKTLEEMAQAVFKQWFVDFEFPFDFAQGKPDEKGKPYKSSGGEMVESELGMIPKGWKVYSMNELLETISKTYPLKTVKDVVFLNTGDIQNGVFLHRNFSIPSTLPGQAKKSIIKGDILYSEIRPENKRFAYVHFDSEEYVVSTKLMVLRSIVPINSLFQYFILIQQEQIDYLQHLAESRSGTFPQITFSELSTIKIPISDFEFVNFFTKKILSSYFAFRFNSEAQNKELIKTRDALLPKLLSGEIDVSEAESIIEESEVLQMAAEPETKYNKF